MCDIRSTVHLMTFAGRSNPGADPTTRWDLLPLGAQLLHGLQPGQRFPCWPGLRDHVYPNVSLHRTKHYQLLWDVADWPQRGHILVPQVKPSKESWKKTNMIYDYLFFSHRFFFFMFIVRMHLALKAYQELLLTVNEMDRSPDESIRQSSNVIKSKMPLIWLKKHTFQITTDGSNWIL